MGEECLKRRLKDRLRTVVAKVLLRTVACLPLPAAHALGAALGWLLAVTPNSLRRVTHINLQMCLPELSDAERERVARRSLVESGKGFLETGAAWCWSVDRILGRVRAVEGEEHIRAAMAQGKGVILAPPHLGAWEVLAQYMGRRYPLTTLARPLRIRGLNSLVCNARCRSGMRVVATDTAGVRGLYDALGRGEMVWIMMDQEPSMGSGIFAPYFGVTAKTAVLLPRLAMRTQALVIFACAERLPKGAGYRLHFNPAKDLVAAGDLAATTRNLNRQAEALVRARASQYLWSYKRFRSRPDEDAKVY